MCNIKHFLFGDGLCQPVVFVFDVISNKQWDVEVDVGVVVRLYWAHNGILVLSPYYYPNLILREGTI